MGGKRSIFLLMRENGNGETKHPLLPARWKMGYGNTEGSPADGALKRSCQKAGGSRFSDAEKEDAVCAFFVEKVLKKVKGKVRLFRIRVAHRVFSPKQKPPEEHGFSLSAIRFLAVFEIENKAFCKAPRTVAPLAASAMMEPQGRRGAEMLR